MNKYITINFSLIFFVFSGVAEARQLDYKLRYFNGKAQFYYKWIDAEGEKHALKFSLPSQDVREGEREFKRFDNYNALRYAFRTMRKEAIRMSTDEVKVLVKMVGNKKISIKVSGRASQGLLQSKVDEMSALQKNLMKEYLEENFYTYYDEKEQSIIPDHAQISRRYKEAVAPIYKAMKRKVRGKSKREIANYVL